MKEKIAELIMKMTIEQKASLCSGKDFWHLKGIEELDIPSIMVTDGPHGLRKQAGESDHIGLNASVPATCFPTAVGLGSSWDVDLLSEVGAALGEECLQEKVAVLLGPGANIKRNPLCGRNFEYFSEDPFHGGKMASALIRGVQSKGVGTSLKHYAANNQENRRMTIDTIVDDRALREIYLAGFEEAVKTAQPDTVMCAYNRLNGEYCSENEFLLTKVLKEEWGHEGLVVTDWGAINDRVKGLEAGLELEMPGSVGVNDKLIVEAVKSGTLSIDVLDKAVTRLLKLIFKTSEVLKTDYKYDVDAHHQLARRAESEAAVLLKNDGALPLKAGSSIAIIGAFAKTPRYQGSGSSLINPIKIENAYDAMVEALPSDVTISYAPGYDPVKESRDQAMIDEAVKVAKMVDSVVLFAGLPDVSESEGFDRPHLDMPDAHNSLIEAVASVNSNITVVLSNGSPVLMPWIDKVQAVLESYLGGQAWGSGIVDILLGKVSPSGKISETFPLALADDPSSANFPGGTKSVVYAESIYVGYRYYDKVKQAVQFPFGHGLSYSSFEYSNLEVTCDGSPSAGISFSIKNTGTVEAKEITQVYVRDVDSAVFRPDKELKGFSKVNLKPGEETKINIALDRRSFAFWDSGNQDWAVEAGEFEILIGASSADLRLNSIVSITSGDELSSHVKGMKELVPEFYQPKSEVFSDISNNGTFAKLLGQNIPDANFKKSEPFIRTSTLGDIRRTFIGRQIFKMVKKGMREQFGTKDQEDKTLAMMEAMVSDMPLRSLGLFDPDRMPMGMIDGLITMMNGRFFKGLGQLQRARKELKK